MAILAILLAKLIDPVLIVLAVIAGLTCRLWRHVAIASVIIGAAIEFLLIVLSHGRGFSPGGFVLGTLAALAWGSLVFFIRKRWPKKA